jgi:hypothetical protein
MRLRLRAAAPRAIAGAAAVVLATSLLPDAGAAVRVAAGPPKQFVLSPEGNHLWAYDADTGAAQLLIRGENAGDPGADTPERRDINGQICVSPDGNHFISGEDTVYGGDGGDGGSSHDPRIAGWGFFEISGKVIGGLQATQVGKLAPEAGPTPPGSDPQDHGYAGDPDNYGCGFLDQRRLFTTAIGNTYPGQEANGQLFLWFGPFDAGFAEVPPDPSDGDPGFFVGEVAHCEIDETLATAGGIAVDDNGDVYVAANRPDDAGNAGGVWRYRPVGKGWPSSLEQCTPEYLAANVVKEQLIPALPVPAVPELRSPTPSSVVISPADTLYVASVFSGTVSEYGKDGAWLRDVYPLAPVAPRTGPTGDTPFGLAFTADGSLWIADLGIIVGAPAPGLGSVIRVRFDAAGNPTPLGERVAENLTFPDGLGVYTANKGGTGA